MSDEQQDTPAPTTGEQPQSEWNPPASQAELDRIVQNRLERERAKFADYDALQEKARYWDEIEQASKTEMERAQEDIARRDSRVGSLQTRLVSSQIKALAASDFADPSDALAALSDPSKYLGLEDEIDEAAIKADLAALLERKPHWRRASDAPAGPRVPAPNPAQGSGVNGKPAMNPAAEFQAFLQRQIAGG